MGRCLGWSGKQCTSNQQHTCIGDADDMWSDGGCCGGDGLDSKIVVGLVRAPGQHASHRAAIPVELFLYYASGDGSG